MSSSNPTPRCTISLYLSSPYFRPLLDLVFKDEGYASRSDFVSDMLTFVFTKKGLWNKKRKRPTKDAMKRSPQLRKIKAMLDMLKSNEEGSRLLFVGMAEELLETRKKRTPT